MTKPAIVAATSVYPTENAVAVVLTGAGQFVCRIRRRVDLTADFSSGKVGRVNICVGDIADDCPNDILEITCGNSLGRR